MGGASVAFPSSPASGPPRKSSTPPVNRSRPEAESHQALEDNRSEEEGALLRETVSRLDRILHVSYLGATTAQRGLVRPQGSP
jgi:hypothetical protein